MTMDLFPERYIQITMGLQVLQIGAVLPIPPSIIILIKK